MKALLLNIFPTASTRWKRFAALVMAASLAWPAWGALSVNNVNGTVTDSTTSLVWDQCAYGLSGNTCTSGTAILATWPQALVAVVAANAASYKGFTDWRVPNAVELESIAKIDRWQPAIDTSAFPNTPISDTPISGGAWKVGGTWASTSYAPNPSDAWVVYFGIGNPDAGNKGDTHYVRLVRSGQSLASFDALNPSIAPVQLPQADFATQTAGLPTIIETFNGYSTGSKASPFAIANGTYTGTPSVMAGLWCPLSQCMNSQIADGLFSGFPAGTTHWGTRLFPSSTGQVIQATVTGASGTLQFNLPASTSSSTFVGFTDPAGLQSVAFHIVGVGGFNYAFDDVTAAGATVSVLSSYAITAAASPVAGGTVSCTPNPVNYGGSSTCTATANAGYSFTAWSGDCTGATCVLSNVTAVKSVTAAFVTTTPSCTLSASPASVSPGGTSTLTASCSPAATSYVWTGGTCAGTTAASCTVTPSVTTAYTVTGINGGGTGVAARAAVAVRKTYSDNADGTVTDPTTGLVWMRCAMGQTWDGAAATCTGTASSYTWDQAIALSGTFSFAGQGDWRLPNIRELQTIVDRSVYNPAIDVDTFPNTSAWAFWSASADASNSSYAWLVAFSFGGAYNYDKSYGSQVRLVRAGQSLGLLDIARPSTDYVDQGNGTVTHTPTSLVWQRCAVGQTWTGSTCSGTTSTFTLDAARLLSSTFAGQADWRLPTEDELISLVDYSRYVPAINDALFPNTSTFLFWSASAGADSSNGAWVVYFYTGSAYGYLGEYGGVPVRLVRAGQSFDSFTLTVNKTGNGTVNGSALTGIACGSACTGQYTIGTSVILSALPSTGNTFTGWSGACIGTAATCTVSMSTAKSVSAIFAPITYAITVTANPAAGGTASCTPNPVVIGGSSTCTATPNAGYTFTTWSGDCTGATCVLSNVTAVKNVTATFTLAVPVVSLNPTSLTFTEQNVGTTSAVKTVKLTNTGAATLSISSLAPSLAVFALTHDCGPTLAAGAFCTLSISFKPVEIGTRLGSITVGNNAAGNPHSVTVSGVGVASNAPICSLSAAPAKIQPHRSTTLTASCNQADAAFTWTGGTCAGKTTATCTDSPAVTTTYGVTGTNSYGASTASTIVTVKTVDLTPILMLLLD